jgi:hypothetical protein
MNHRIPTIERVRQRVEFRKLVFAGLTLGAGLLFGQHKLSQELANLQTTDSVVALSQFH